MLRRRVAGRPWGVRPLLFHVLPALAIITPGACIDSPPTDSPGFTVTVAPLTLPGVADACYDLAVYNVAAAALTPSARVWSREGVCADRFGDGASAISYVGACDASPSGRPHTVSLTLLGLCTQDGCDVGDDLDPRTLSSTSYQNPCPELVALSPRAPLLRGR